MCEIWFELVRCCYGVCDTRRLVMRMMDEDAAGGGSAGTDAEC